MHTSKLIVSIVPLLCLSTFTHGDYTHPQPFNYTPEEIRELCNKRTVNLVVEHQVTKSRLHNKVVYFLNLTDKVVDIFFTPVIATLNNTERTAYLNGRESTGMRYTMEYGLSLIPSLNPQKIQLKKIQMNTKDPRQGAIDLRPANMCKVVIHSQYGPTIINPSLSIKDGSVYRIRYKNKEIIVEEISPDRLPQKLRTKLIQE